MRHHVSAACVVSALGILGAVWAPASAQEACGNRGQLDTLYCDENKDLVADVPKDRAKWRDPATLGAGRTET